jgi:flagellar basal body-associated protein FliL
MSSYVAMSVLIGVLALALLGYFAFMWIKEKGRSDEESADSSRQRTDTGNGPDQPGPRR